MANENYVNTTIGSVIDSPLDSRKNVISSVSFLSDSTFSESDFGDLEDTQNVQNDQSNDINSNQNAALYDNDVTGNFEITSQIKRTKMKGKDQFTDSRSQPSYLYANNDMIRKERESVAPPLPRRKGRGRKIAHRMSKMPSSVWHEVHGWSSLKSTIVSIICFVTGAGLCIFCYFGYEFIDKVYFKQHSHHTNEGNRCEVLEELKYCSNFMDNDDEMKTFHNLSAKCSKIQEKFIKDQKYIIYEDRVSFVEAMEFCHRIAQLTMVYFGDIECKSINNYTVNWNDATVYWIGHWYHYNEVSPNNNKTTGSWYKVNPTDEIKPLAEDRCANIQTNNYGENERCWSGSNCEEKQNPICKC